MSSDQAPTVSIVVPCYNHGELIAHTVNSIACQTFTDWECIIVNDGSTDNSEDVVLALAQKDPRIRYFSQENKGPSGARNRALDEIRGRYVQFLDADDILDPAKMEIQVSQLLQFGGLALASCDFQWLDIDGKVIDACPDSRHYIDASNALLDLTLNWQHEIIIPPCCFLFDARFFTEHHIREDESIRANEDYDLLIKVLALQPEVVFDNRKLAGYRITPGSVSSNKARLRTTYFHIIDNQLRVFADSPGMIACLRTKKRLVQQDFWHCAPPTEVGWWLYKVRSAAKALLPSGIYTRIKRTLIRG